MSVPSWPRPGEAWLTCEDHREDAVVVRVVGGVSAGRATELWSALEGALECAMGRPVVADLTRATGFDVHTIDSLAQVGRAAVRRHVEVRAVIHASSALDYYARSCGLDRLIPIVGSLAAASGSRPLYLVGRGT
jgi:hypothetical protein